MKRNEKYQNALIIAPREKWDEFFEYRKEYPETRFTLMDAKGVEDLFLNQYDARALRYLLEKGYSLEKAKDILGALALLKKRQDEDAKLKGLSALYEELSKSGLLFRHVYPERTFLGKRVIYSGYLDVTRIGKALQNVEGVDASFEEEERNALPPLCLFKDPYAELHYVFNRIAKLLDEGVSPDDIYLANVDDGYSYILPLLARAYGFTIAPFSQRRLLDLPIGRKFLSLFEENSLEDSLSKLGESFALDPNFDSLSKRLRELEIASFDKEKQTALYRDLLKSLTEKHRPLVGAVRVFTGHAAPKGSRIFYLNFSLGKAPHLSKDDGYLSDKELHVLGAMKSSDKNIESEAELRALIQSGHIELLSRTRHSFEGETFDSPLADATFGHEKLRVLEDPTLDYEYSKDFAAFELANLLDIKNDFLIDSPKIAYLQNLGIGNTYTWGSYNPVFAPFDAEQKDRSFYHSYSAIDIYYQCPFHYYLARILKVDDSESSFSARLGTIAHQMFELAYQDPTLEFEGAYGAALEEERGKAPFDAREELFLSKTKDVLAAAFAFQKELTNATVNPTYLTEYKIDVTLHEKAKLIGSIDRATIFGLHSDKLVITDYKTGDSHFDESLFEDGLGLQLPIYAYAAHKMPELEGKDIVGLFISRILPSSALHDQTSLEKYYGNVFRLKGLFLNDISALNAFAGESLNHIAGTKIKKDGTFQYLTSVRDRDVFENIADIAERKLLEADAAIRASRFDIRPVKASGIKSGSAIDACEYCPFRDCCYRKDDVYRVIHKKEAKAEVEDEGKEESDE